MAFNLEKFNLDFKKRMSLYQKELAKEMPHPGTTKMRLYEKCDRVRAAREALREELQRKERILRESEEKYSRLKKEREDFLKQRHARFLHEVKETEKDRAEIQKLKEEFAALERNLQQTMENAEETTDVTSVNTELHHNNCSRISC